MEIYFIVISSIGVVSNVVVYIYDKKKRENLLQSKNPMEEFERFTEKSLLERGLKTLTDVDPIHELSDDSDDPP